MIPRISHGSAILVILSDMQRIIGIARIDDKSSKTSSKRGQTQTECKREISYKKFQCLVLKCKTTDVLTNGDCTNAIPHKAFCYQ